MKCTLILALALFAVVSSEELYSTENDDLDIEAVVKDPEQLNAFAGCFLDKSKCNDLTAHFKKDLAEAVNQACAKCTPAQKHLLKRFLEALEEKMPEDFQAFKAKYDPENKNFTALKQAIANA